MKNFPLLGVSIALAYKEKPIIGAINLPFFKELYFAEKGKGAFLNGKRISVSEKSDLKKAFVLTDLNFRYLPDKKMDMIKKIKGKVYDIRVLGCAVYGYTSIAKGNADAFLSPLTNSWDVAAGALIVEEAGGKVTNFKGKEWDLKQDNFIASNGRLHGGLLKMLS